MYFCGIIVESSTSCPKHTATSSLPCSIKMMPTLRYFFTLLALALTLTLGAQETVEIRLPAEYRVTTNLNVRSLADSYAPKIGTLNRGDRVVVLEILNPYYDRDWGRIRYGDQNGFVALDYLEYIAPVEPEPAPDVAETDETSTWRPPLWHRIYQYGETLFGWMWTLFKWFFWITVIGLVLVYKETVKLILGLIIYAAIMAGVGAFIFYLFGWNTAVGAWIGFGLVAFMVLGKISESVEGGDGLISLIFLFFKWAYILSTLVFYIPNRLEHFLVAPWRYFFHTNWASDANKPALRLLTETVTVVMYVLTTPLRLYNAAVYNLGFHCILGLYDLLIEVLMPSDPDEGGEGIGQWIVMLPYRVFYYLVWHGVLLVTESLIWTAVDIFIPARTFYHGTSLNAANQLLCDPQRNDHLKRTSGWCSGNFMSSTTQNRTWGGRGVYFAMRRSLAMDYGDDDRSGLGGDPVMIVCRVSLGRVISYALTPDSVYNQAGQYGNHAEFNKFADAHGYTTGEWYNGKVWEYCLLDWQNGYNDLWRIRPAYVLNLRTGLPQHIRGGMQHWLFDAAVWRNIFGD